MSFDLNLKPSCGGCGSTSDLYGSNCKHMTLCFNCGKRMTQNRAKCSDCGTQITRLIRDDDDDDEANEEESGGLSKSGKELKKLLGRADRINDSDAEDDDDNDDEADDDMSMSPVLAPKKKDAHTPKEELVDIPAKASHSTSTRGTPSTTSKSTKTKRKASGDDAKVSNGAPLKTVKLETESKSSAKEGSALASKGNNTIPLNGSASLSAKAPADPSTGPFTEEEIRAVLLESAPITTQGLVAEFRERLKSKEDKNAFVAILRRISKIQKVDEAKYVVLMNNNAIPSRGSTLSSAKASADPSTGRVTEEEIRAVLVQSAPLTTQGLVAEFWERLVSEEDRNAFAAILRRISKIQKVDEAKYVVLRDNNAITSRGSTLSSAKASADPSTGRVTEEEIRAFLVQSSPLTTQELVAKFKRRLNLKEEKNAFAAILRRISKIRKFDGANYVVLRDK
ncbi:hypothetical protein MKW98_019857 [Papaver atlanticum]|uniref:Transcription initiation factor IIF subunit alpha n=1 Tax=Papaver atlanticum TaxID=357466 RepID=A0AAD4S0Y2_9MAGN|nr:hypothetical protein MKW98_019857 [Papaver atlanticum]